MRGFTITIADLLVRFRFPKVSYDFIDLVFERYKGFTRVKKEMIAEIEVYLIKDFPNINRFFSSLRFMVGDGFVYENGMLFIKPNIYLFDNFLRVFYSYELSLRDGFLVHGAALSYRDNGFLVIGKSGVGKTTISNMLCDSFEVMSDEIAAVRFIKKPYIYSTPFWGSFKKTSLAYMKTLLSEVFFPVKAKKVYLKEVSFNYSFKKALRCVLNFSQEKMISERILSNLFSLLSYKKPKLLYFSKDGKDILASLLISSSNR